MDGSGLPEQTDDVVVVDSRWWYWIAIYPLAVLVMVPTLVILGLLAFLPVIVVAPGGEPGPIIGAAIFGLLIGLIVLMVAVVLTVIIFLFPVALYIDAKAVARARGDWQPDPVVYALLGILQFVLTPVIGIGVALYYLFRRHETIGTP